MLLCVVLCCCLAGCYVRVGIGLLKSSDVLYCVCGFETFDRRLRWRGGTDLDGGLHHLGHRGRVGDVDACMYVCVQ